MKYLTVGQASIDRMLHEDGSVSETRLGGPCVFAYTGIRLYDDDCQMILNTAEDFEPYFGDWIKKNDVNTEACYLCYDKTHVFEATYRDDGSYIYLQPHYSVKTLCDRAAEYAWTNVRPEQIGKHSKGTKGLYMFLEPYYKQFYKQLHEIKKKNGFEIMYEIGILKGDEYDRNYILEILNILKPEMASLNHNEACEFFETEDIDVIFNEIKEMGFQMFFYRAGNKGSYTLVKDKAYFIPSIDIPGRETVDPTGCGNSSTAASMWAWINTRNPVMTGILANIVGGYNVSYAGIIDDLNEKNRKEAFELAKAYYRDYIREHPEYVDEGYESDPDYILKEFDL